MIRPFELIKLPVPPRPAGPTDTRASERQAAPLLDVPSMSFAGTRKPIAFKAGSSAVASVIGHERKREGCNADGGAVVIAALMRAVRKTKVDAVNLRRPVSMHRGAVAKKRQETRRGVNVSVNGKDLADALSSLVHAEFHLFTGSPLSCASLLELLVPYTIPIAAAAVVLDLVMVACTLVHRLGGISAEISTAVGLVIRSAGVCSGAWHL